MNKKTIIMCALALVSVCAFGVGAKKPVAKSNLTTVSTRRVTDKGRAAKNVVAQKLRKCDFLVNKKFKKDAKFYLCLFSASWCPPCRAEMPRIAQTYVETLKDDPDIELIHFSRDQNDAKAMAWAKEHDVKFPVVRPRGGNPLDLRCKGIPHLFIVKADGTLIEEGHPMNIFNEDKFQEIKGGGSATSGKSQVWNGGKAPSAQKEDFKAKLTGIAIIEGGHMGEYVTRADHAEFQDPDRPIEIPYGEAACFRVEYDFPEGYQAQVSIRGRWPQGQNMSSYIGWSGESSFGAFFRGRGVAYGFLTMHEDGETCTLGQLSIGVIAKPKVGWMVTEEPPVHVKFQGPETTVKKEAEIDGYTWSCLTGNGETRIMSPTGDDASAISPKPTGDLVIPSMIDGAPVTKIGKYTFRGSSDLTSVEIPKTVISIGEWAFSDCSKLAAVTIPSSVTCVGGAVFADCPELREIGLEAGNPRYKVVDGVLYTKDMKRLVVGPGGKVSHTIPAGVTDIANDAFRCCRMLRSVTIPSGVRRIGEGAFCGTALQSVVIPSSVKKIERFAFFICSRMTSLTLAEGVESIEEFAFDGNSALTSVSIPSSVKYIGKEAFSGCKGLESVTMRGERPDSEDKVFEKCDNLQAIHVPSDAKSWAGMTEWQGIPLVFDGE